MYLYMLNMVFIRALVHDRKLRLPLQNRDVEGCEQKQPVSLLLTPRISVTCDLTGFFIKHYHLPHSEYVNASFVMKAINLNKG